MGAAMSLFALYSFLTWTEINLPFPLTLSNPCFRVLDSNLLRGAQSFRINSRSVDQHITSFLWSCSFITAFGRALSHINPVHTLVCQNHSYIYTLFPKGATIRSFRPKFFSMLEAVPSTHLLQFGISLLQILRREIVGRKRDFLMK